MEYDYTRSATSKCGLLYFPVSFIGVISLPTCTSRNVLNAFLLCSLLTFRCCISGLLGAEMYEMVIFKIDEN